MLSFIIRRLLIIVPMALLVVTVTWGLIRMAPGNFYSTTKKPCRRRSKPISTRNTAWINLGIEQYGIMMGNIVQGDFGDSLKYRRTVGQRDHLATSAVFGDHRNFRLSAGARHRLDGRNRRRAQAKFGVRLRFDVAGDARAIRAEFRHRSDSGFDFFAVAVYFSAGALGRNCQSGAAGHYACRRFTRLISRG